MVSLTLQQFRDQKVCGFPGWETAVTPDYEDAEPYVQPIDARYGGPAFPLGTDPGAACSAFEQWCADHLSAD